MMNICGMYSVNKIINYNQFTMIFFIRSMKESYEYTKVKKELSLYREYIRI